MLSFIPQSSALPTHSRDMAIAVNDLGKLHDAVEPFTKLIGQTCPSVVLHCAVPTWSISSDTCLDLHDLNELRSRFLLFIHDLMGSLRAAGVTVSYRLAPANSSMCLVYALPPELSSSQIKAAALNALQSAPKLSKRKNVFMTELEFGPALIVT